jgi:hypothetical protein
MHPTRRAGGVPSYFRRKLLGGSHARIASEEAEAEQRALADTEAVGRFELAMRALNLTAAAPQERAADIAFPIVVFGNRNTEFSYNRARGLDLDMMQNPPARWLRGNPFDVRSHNPRSRGRGLDDGPGF